MLTCNTLIYAVGQATNSNTGEVALRTITPQPVTSAQLYTAIDMYTVGIQASNSATRFLILYSALALASLFKVHSGNQSSVDKLMLVVRPSIPQSPSPKRKGENETVYTMLRNNLIHAEERGCDPEKAVAEIEKHVKDFQELVSHVFLSL